MLDLSTEVLRIPGMTRTSWKDLARLVFLSGLVLSFTTARADEAKAPAEYPIHLTRPDKVGDRFSITAQGALLRETAMQLGKVSRTITQDGYGVHLDGSVEVLAVRPDGRASEVSLTVKKCTGIVD